MRTYVGGDVLNRRQLYLAPVLLLSGLVLLGVALVNIESHSWLLAAAGLLLLFGLAAADSTR
jgi:hypothetical protein